MKSILLIGVGRFGRHAALTLEKLNHQVMVVDRIEERVDSIMAHVTNARLVTAQMKIFSALLELAIMICVLLR